MSSTDMDISIRENIKCEVIEEGATTINSQLIYDIIKKLHDDSKIEIISNDGKLLTLRSGVSKFSLSGLTKSLALELAPSIQVNEIALGAILPPSDLETKEYNKPSDSFGPSKRMGKISEITNVIEMLINNDYITGETINIDGGRNLI